MVKYSGWRMSVTFTWRQKIDFKCYAGFYRHGHIAILINLSMHLNYVMLLLKDFCF